MQVLLLQDVPGLGRAGQIKEAAGGYALNYLIPRKLAVAVTEGALKQAQTVKEAAARKADRKADEAKTLLGKLDGQSVTFKARAGEGDRLYGSITAPDVAEALSKSIGFEVDRRLVDLEHPIKSLGEHRVQVKIAAGLAATVWVVVERASQEA
jgi:large subunit ribosomal protein L9